MRSRQAAVRSRCCLHRERRGRCPLPQFLPLLWIQYKRYYLLAQLRLGPPSALWHYHPLSRARGLRHVTRSWIPFWHDRTSFLHHINLEILQFCLANLRCALCANLFCTRFLASESSILVQSSSSGERINGLHTSSIIVSGFYEHELEDVFPEKMGQKVRKFLSGGRRGSISAGAKS